MSIVPFGLREFLNVIRAPMSLHLFEQYFGILDVIVFLGCFSGSPQISQLNIFLNHDYVVVSVGQVLLPFDGNRQGVGPVVVFTVRQGEQFLPHFLLGAVAL